MARQRFVGAEERSELPRKAARVSSVEIVKRTDDVKGFKVLPRRWVVERSFGRLVRNRRLARDYERLTATSEAMIKVAMIRLMLVRLAGQPSRWSHESHRKTARTKTVEDLIAA
ncbi:transposase [Streptomyces sp. MMS24-I29]|uniref:transposase n=1 Tax=Streptomyces sp. MMS24-I29 TaxID=3351480 RepID=UPI003C7B32C8